MSNDEIAFSEEYDTPSESLIEYNFSPEQRAKRAVFEMVKIHSSDKTLLQEFRNLEIIILNDGKVFVRGNVYNYWSPEGGPFPFSIILATNAGNELTRIEIHSGTPNTACGGWRALSNDGRFVQSLYEVASKVGLKAFTMRYRRC